MQISKGRGRARIALAGAVGAAEPLRARDSDTMQHRRARS